MKRTIYASIALISCHIAAFSQKIDTVQIRNQVYALTLSSSSNALHKVVEEDQKYRGADTNDSLDLAHLIWLSYFMDRFGYPDKKIYGNDSFSASVIWIHNHRLLRIASFPIIFNAFLSGQIRENDLRDYYLRTVYTYCFDDEGYLHLSLNDLFKVLKLNTHHAVSVAELLRVSNDIQEFKKQPKKRIGVWKSDAGSKTYDKDGKKITVGFEGDRVEIYQTPDGKIFVGLSSSYGAREAQELYLSGDGTYRFQLLKTDSYYKVSGEELQLMRGDKVEKIFKKI